ncbi:MAG: rRNA maturation RNase YbeY, partial [Chitinophagales bacterium]
SYHKTIESINYIFLNDEGLLAINKEYLNHDYYTDIITFNNSDDKNILSTDIYISIDRVKDNAQQLNIAYQEELIRVMAHGVLHLVGFKDKTKQAQIEMRQAENKAIQLFEHIKNATT